MMLTIELRSPMYKELVEAAGMITPECTTERFAALVIESEMASRRLEKIARPRSARAASLARTGDRLGAPIP